MAGQDVEERDGGEWVDPGEIEPRLMLIGPRGRASDQNGIDHAVLEAALAAASPGALVLDPALWTPDARLAGLDGCRRLCHAAGTALLIGGPGGHAAAVAIDCGADGVHLDAPEGVLRARGILGAGRLIGVRCALSRHRAMIAGEGGADYVAFDAEATATPTLASPDGAAVGSPHDGVAAAEDLVRWWGELFVLPVAVACPPELKVADRLARAGADFVAIGGSAWAMSDAFIAQLERLAATLRVIRTAS